MPSDGGVAVAAVSDPAAAFEEVLSKELLQMSLKDRNDLQEEIHGVQCLALEETSELVKESLRKLAIELDLLPNAKKRAFLQSQQHPESKAYVNNEEFRLRFLRCELFDCRKAAVRMARVCNCLVELFGNYALTRPIRITDFSNTELKGMRKGRAQILPFRDRCGRRIAIIFPGAEFVRETANNLVSAHNLRIKIFLYMSSVLALDVDAQRRGVVFLVWFDAKLESRTSTDVSGLQRGFRGIKNHQVTMVRGSAIHICSPDTPFYRLQRSIMSMGVGPYRSRLRIHLGEPMELRYILNGYGISTDTIPISWTGTVKVGYLKQWMQIRQCLEDPSIYSNMGNDGKFGSSKTGNNKFSPPIECPNLNDVLFKKGKSAKNHPGNALFRSLIQSKYEHERVRTETESAIDDQNRKTSSNNSDKSGIIKLLVAHFVGEVQEGNLRLLMWNEKKSWWSILDNERLIRKKIENTVISIIEISDTRPPLLSQEETLQETPEEKNSLFGAWGDLDEGDLQCLEGVTSMFGSQERDFGNKRRRLEKNDSSDESYRNFMSSDDETISCINKCFGL